MATNNLVVNVNRVMLIGTLVLAIASPIATAAIFYSKMVEAERVAQTVRDNPMRIKAVEDRLMQLEAAVGQWQDIKISTAETAIRMKYIEQMLERHMQEKPK